MVRTRFSPSPTGMLHLGNARTALFSCLYARHAQGTFLIRVEDTDAARSDTKFIDLLLDDLKWLGLSWQEGPMVKGGEHGEHGPYRQSQRHPIYEQYYKKLEEMGNVFPCFCTDQELALNRKLQLARGHAPRYLGTCRKLSKEEIDQRLAKGLKPALRFHVPEGALIEFDDLVKGPQKFASDDIGDFIIRRADGSSSFMFCNAIDDSLMDITHVIRGEDHLTNTPRQLMLTKALGLRAPQYGHLSLILGDDGSPLSKRHGSFSLHDLRMQGYLPQAVLNYLARLSHAYEKNQLMSFEELAHGFHLNKISRSPARFDQNQLLHWQKEAVMTLDPIDAWVWLGDEVIKQKVPEQKQQLFINLMRQNILFPADAMKWVNIVFENVNFCFTEEQQAIIKEAGEIFFNAAMDAVRQHKGNLKSVFDELKLKLNISGKKLFMPIRIALTGEEHGPELAPIAELMGTEKMIARLGHVLEQEGAKEKEGGRSAASL